jgi:hypothetical protein
MKRRRLLTWSVLAVGVIGISGIVGAAVSLQWVWYWASISALLWTLCCGLGWYGLRRMQRRRLRVKRQGRQVRVEGERLAYEDEGRLLWVLRKDIARIREWPRHGLVVDTHDKKGVLTIPLDSENYHELRVALMLWDPNILESVNMRIAKS